MKPETTTILAKAHRDLRDARTVAEGGVLAVAARCAYYAAFHAAEALICEIAGKMPKTHKGVHSEFSRLLKDQSVSARPLQAFLTRTYKLKQDNDYGPAESADFPLEEASEAIPMAIDFVEAVERLLAEHSQPKG